jgi:hypothetical protein
MSKLSPSKAIRIVIQLSTPQHSLASGQNQDKKTTHKNLLASSRTKCHRCDATRANKMPTGIENT